MTPPAPRENKTKAKVQQKNNQEQYEAPSLVNYGPMIDLTKGTGSMNADMVANRRKN